MCHKILRPPSYNSWGAQASPNEFLYHWSRSDNLFIQPSWFLTWHACWNGYEDSTFSSKIHEIPRYLLWTQDLQIIQCLKSIPEVALPSHLHLTWILTDRSLRIKYFILILDTNIHLPEHSVCISSKNQNCPTFQIPVRTIPNKWRDWKSKEYLKYYEGLLR